MCLRVWHQRAGFVWSCFAKFLTTFLWRWTRSGLRTKNHSPPETNPFPLWVNPGLKRDPALSFHRSLHIHAHLHRCAQPLECIQVFANNLQRTADPNRASLGFTDLRCSLFFFLFMPLQKRPSSCTRIIGTAGIQCIFDILDSAVPFYYHSASLAPITWIYQRRLGRRHFWMIVSGVVNFWDTTTSQTLII